MSKYVVGIDFGTLSARALIAEIGTGRELAVAAADYPHGVMDRQLPDGTRLPPDWALQHPRDYLDCLTSAMGAALAQSGVGPEDVIGLGVDFTACTLLALDASGAPLCFSPELASEPHAYAKLWKHHGAQAEANRITEIAAARGEPFLARYGGKCSSESMFPRIWQMLKEAPELYHRTARFVEAGDWLVSQLTGADVAGGCAAGYKSLWHKRDGYPPESFFAALDPRLEHVVAEKLGCDIRPVGAKAGELTEQGALLTGLLPGTAVAVCNVDAHVSLPGAGVTAAGDMLMIMGTSACHIMASAEERIVPGLCGVVEDGVIPGLLGYEAGQTCMGDHYNWFVDSCVPESYAQEARDRGLNLHQLLTERAALLSPGQSGLLALDWWNGNRSVLVDVDLTGLVMGLTLTTKPEELYRALIEATAFGARVIFDAFESSGVPIERVFSCGGISQKNPLLMQIYADVLGREIRVARSAHASALGSALFGAVAAGSARGGYDSIVDASREMAGEPRAHYRPIPDHVGVYDRLYAEYKLLHDYFGRGGSDAMKRLKRIRDERSQQ